MRIMLPIAAIILIGLLALRHGVLYNHVVKGTPFGALWIAPLPPLATPPDQSPCKCGEK